MPTSFAEREKTTLQGLSEAVSRMSALRTSEPSSSDHVMPTLSRSERTELFQKIRARHDRAVLLVRAYASTGARSEERARKAAAWGIVGTTIPVIALAIVAVVTTGFSFGAAVGALVAAIAAQIGLLTTAAQRGDPLAGELSSILASMGEALRDVLRDEYPGAAAIARFLASTDDAFGRLERLSNRTAAVAGSSDGDPRAVFAAGRELAESLNGFVALLRLRATAQADTSAVADGLGTLQRATADAVQTVATKH